MAPRRGGSSGGGGSGFSSSSGNQCSENGAFGDKYSIAFISTDAVTLFLLLLVLDLWIRARKKNLTVREVLTMWGFGLAVVMCTL
jgi:hypothetical protein